MYVCRGERERGKMRNTEGERERVAFVSLEVRQKELKELKETKRNLMGAMGETGNTRYEKRYSVFFAQILFLFF